MKKLILIDGNSLLFRAFFAMRPMVTASGIHTQGIYAFINMLNKIIGDYEPDYMAVAFDMKEKTFRHDAYDEYKAGRQQTPIELLQEIPLIHKVLEAMNIAVLEMPKYEADDLIGTVSVKASAAGISTLVITGDKDELQLVDENVNVLINKKGMSEFDLYDIAAMKERYGLTPKQFIDLKGLMGDKSDNIPGIPGVGEKKGIALLEQYGSVEGVIEHAEEIKGKLGENVRDNIESAKLSKWLATINTEAPIEFTWEQLLFQEPDYDRLIEVYTELEFSTFIKRLPVSVGGADATEEIHDFTAEMEKIKRTDLADFIAAVPAGSVVVAEMITNNSHLGSPSISGISLYDPNGRNFCYKEFTPMDTEITIQTIADMEYRLAGYNLKKTVFSMLYGCDKDPIPYYDIQVAEYLIDANRSKYLIDKMLLRYNNATVEESEFCNGKEGELLQNNSLTEDMLVKRAFYISEIMKEQSKLLEENGLTALFNDCEMPLVLTIADMEKSGISVDPDILLSIGSELEDKIYTLEEMIYRNSGVQFNINSPKQLGTVLFEQLKIPYPKAKGKTASYSTAADILEKLAPNHEIVRNVLEYRKLSKLKSTYVDGLMGLIGSDRKIHPHFQQTVAATGRLSCTEPNLQNIPIRDDYGRMLRKAFVTEKAGNIFTGSDYSQIELRILAALSGDEVLINAFKEGKDIHRATAASVFDIPFDQVTPLDRTKAKAVNFGVVYGMSGFGLGESLSITREEGQKYINDYFSKHAPVKEFLDKQIEEGEKTQEVRTYYGRLRKIPELISRKYMEKEAAKRVAMNTPIQGTAADIIKFAMNSVRSELKNRGLESKLILQIHDELIVEGPEAELEQVKDVLDVCMRGAADLAVELTCDTHSGTTWYDLK